MTLSVPVRFTAHHAPFPRLGDTSAVPFSARVPFCGGAPLRLKRASRSDRYRPHGKSTGDTGLDINSDPISGSRFNLRVTMIQI
jgi:hypothetical protein